MQWLLVLLFVGWVIWNNKPLSIVQAFMNFRDLRNIEAAIEIWEILKQLRSWEVCGLDDPWSFAASNSLMHTIHRCTWKSLQFFIIIIIIMVAWFMRVFQQNALAPSSVYSILPQCIRPHFLSCICVFSFLFTALHVKSLAFCVWEWRRYSIQYNAVMLSSRKPACDVITYPSHHCDVINDVTFPEMW